MQTNDNVGDLPRSVALAWGVAANPQRGPKRELSIERIVEAAIEIADEGGLQAVSMNAIATKLGFTTMSLYRYVAAKDDLTMLMGEYGMGLPPSAEEGEGAGWRERCRRLATALITMYHQHPWLIDVPISGIPVTPNNFAWMDAGMACFDDTQLDDGERVALVLMLNGIVRWQALIHRGYDVASEQQGVSTDELDVRADELMAALVEEDRLPNVHRAMMAGVFTPDSQDPFAFGMERFFDGVEYYIGQVAAGRRGPDPVSVVPDDAPRDKAVKEAARLRREAEVKLREAKRKEREAIQRSRERVAREAEKAARNAEKSKG